MLSFETFILLNLESKSTILSHRHQRVSNVYLNLLSLDLIYHTVCNYHATYAFQCESTLYS